MPIKIAYIRTIRIIMDIMQYGFRRCDPRYFELSYLNGWPKHDAKYRTMTIPA